MAVVVRITVEDVVSRYDDDGYRELRLESSTTVDGSFSLVGSAVDLDVETFYYSVEDVSGTVNTWYRYRFTGTSGAAPTSSYSNPFRPQGITRLRLRQHAMSEYDTGTVLTASAASQTVARAYFADSYRVASNFFQTGRGKGSWLMPTSGLTIGDITRVTDGVPASGYFDISPSWATELVSGTEVEWHWVADPEDWNKAINKALKRYRVLERVPVLGTGESEIPLTDLTWLHNRSQITGMWYYPTTTSVEEPWGSRGRWWSARQEGLSLTLMTAPIIADGDVVYMEAIRKLDEMFTDTSVLPASINLDLLAAYVYDEVLGGLIRPGSLGAAAEKSVYLQARRTHQAKLFRLKREFGPRPRYQDPQLIQPSAVPQPWRAR